MTGFRLFRRDRQHRTSGGMALYIREGFGVVELKTKNGNVEPQWDRVIGKAILLGVSYRSPNQDEEMDEAFYKQLAKVAQSPALVLVGDFNFTDISWKYNTKYKYKYKC